MEESTASISVAPDELLMRRVPAGPTFFQFNRPTESPMGPTWQAFKPTHEDTTGISMSRMKSDIHPNFLDIDEFAARACRGKLPEKHFYVAIISAAQLMKAPLSLELKPDPIDDVDASDPGHILIPRLNTGLAKGDRNSLTLTLAREHCLRVVGPFNSSGRLADRFIDISHIR
jgi:hypothetical protein